jgi:hypothetical protein
MLARPNCCWTSEGVVTVFMITRSHGTSAEFLNTVNN